MKSTHDTVPKSRDGFPSRKLFVARFTDREHRRSLWYSILFDSLLLVDLWSRVDTRTDALQVLKFYSWTRYEINAKRLEYLRESVCVCVWEREREREREKVETSLEPMAHMQIEVRRAETRERNLLTRGSWVPDMTSRPVCWNLAGIVTEIEIRSDGETAEDGIYARQIRSFCFIMRWIIVKLRTETFRVVSRRKCRSCQTGTLCNCLGR